MENITVVSPALHKTNVSKLRQVVAFLWLMVGLFVVPEFAQADPFSEALDWAVDLLTNGIARSAAILAIVIAGYLAWAGRITGEIAFRIILGIVLVFGGATIVDLVSGSISKSS